MRDFPTAIIRNVSTTSPAARDLIASLNAELLALYPEDGTEQYFRLDADEVSEGQVALLVAYVSGEAVACEAIRMPDATTAEIKRMYVRPDAGVGELLA